MFFKSVVFFLTKAAQYFVGYFYANGISVGRDWTEATKWYKKAAEQHNPDATNNLGLCYEYGNGVPRNYREAFNCYLKASVEGLSGKINVKIMWD